MKKSQFQFSSPFLSDMLFTENDTADAAETDIEISLNSITKVKIYEGENRAFVSLSIGIGEPSNGSPFCVRVTMATFVKWEDGLTDSLIETILKSNVPSLLLGYARPIISNITSNSRYETYNIPFIDFTNNEEIDVGAAKKE